MSGRHELRARLQALLGDHYRLEEELARGGAGVVFRARDTRHDRSVAVKALLRVGGATAPERFRREIRIAAQLSHPLIVPLHDSGGDGELLYYIMPCVEGRSLQERLAEGAPLPFPEVLSVVRDVAEALDYAHEMGVVHRDIKPANILLSQGHALVTDFGVAHALRAAEGLDVTATFSGGVGTPAYMSPEQALGGAEAGNIDGRADVYALGCVVYEMLTGTRPFKARTPLGQIAHHIQATIPTLGTRRPDVPAAVSTVLERALAKDPEDRFATAGAFARALTEAGAELLDATAGDGPGRISRRAAPRPMESFRTPGVAAVAAVLVLMVVMMVVSSRGTVPAASAVSPRSVLAVGFAPRGASEGAHAEAAALASAVTVELNRWDSIYAVPEAMTGGPRFDLGLTGATMTGDDGVRLAREVGADALLALDVDVGEEGIAGAQVSLLDARSGRPLRRPWVFEGAPRGELARRIAMTLLGLDVAIGDTGVPMAGSTQPAAVRAYVDGTARLEQWDLEGAAAAFRSALEVDPDFAMASHKLAMTLYWSAGHDFRRLRDLGPEIARLSATALRNTAGIRAQDSLHIRGFFAFQEGDYPAAREIYRRLLEDVPTDVYAHVMLGSVELADPWLEDRDGTWVPRSDLDVAQASMREALRLQPAFELAYGRLLEVPRELAQAAYFGACPGFEEPGRARYPPWEARDPLRMHSYCPVLEGGAIRWVSQGEFRSQSSEIHRAAADQVFDEVLATIRRWTAYAPDRPQAWLMLRDALLDRRRRSGAPQSPSEIHRVTDEARLAAETGLALQSDTTAADLILVANLRSAVDDVAGGLRLVDRVPRPERTAAAANTLLLAGRLSEALEAASRSELRLFLQDPQGGGVISYGGAESVVDRLQVLAPLASVGVVAGEDFRRLDAFWGAPAYDEAARSVLFADAARRLFPLLAADPEAFGYFDARTDLQDPVWTWLRAPVPAEGRGLERVLVATELDGTAGAGSAGFAFGAARIALEAGAYETALRLLSRLDSLPFRVRRFDAGWGLKAVAAFHRGEVARALGDVTSARQQYQKFIDGWSNGDSLSATPLEEARRRLAGRSGQERAPGGSPP